MTVDTSVFIAVLRGEADADQYLTALGRAGEIQLSAATYVETAIVVDNTRDPVISGRFDQLLAELDAEIRDVTVNQVRLARDAYRNFGKGSGHPARLNYGDCFAYALATETRTPLLFKGEDFERTGVVAAL
ncbi:MAG: type II toxin-antitoxin system VapC family toxin [Frankiaceae bacterium]